MTLTSKEASDPLLDDPQFQRRIRAVSLNVRCLFLTYTILRDKKHFLVNAEITTIEPFQHVVLRAMS